MSRSLAACAAIALAVGLATPIPAHAGGTDLNKVAAATLRYAQTMVGKLPSAAARCARAHGYTLRIVSVDGKQRVITMDYWATRIDLEFVAGRISKVSVG